MTEPEKFKLKNLLWGLIIPVLVGIVIILFPTVLKNALDSWFPAGDPLTGEGMSPYAFLTIIFTHGFSLMVMFAIPLILGLNWNKWAGGAAGFVMGTLYYLAFAGYNTMWTINNYVNTPLAGTSVEELKLFLASTPNLYRDPSFIGNYIVGGILIGYIAGALNNRSYRFKRMLGAGLTAAITVGVLQFVLNMTVSFAAWMSQSDPFGAFYQVMVPMVILGILGPIIAKISYGSEISHPG